MCYSAFGEMEIKVHYQLLFKLTTLEQSNQAIEFLESGDEEPSYTLAILNWIAIVENSMFCIVDFEKHCSLTEHT